MYIDDLSSILDIIIPILSAGLVIFTQKKNIDMGIYRFILGMAELVTKVVLSLPFFRRSGGESNSFSQTDPRKNVDNENTNTDTAPKAERRELIEEETTDDEISSK